MATMEKTNRAMERLAKTTGDSYKTVIGHAVALQERNVRFAQGLVDASIEEFRAQAEANRSVAEELVDGAERQHDAFRTLIEESVDAYTDTYTDLAYAPFAYFRQGLRLVETEVIGDGFPIPNYDEMNVAEIRERLDGLTAAQIREIREYEKRNKNRESLIDQFDRKLRAASA
jgi:hypothetical protein